MGERELELRKGPGLTAFDQLFGERVRPHRSRSLSWFKLEAIVKEATDDAWGCLDPLARAVFEKRYLHGLTQAQTGIELSPPLSRWQVGRIERIAKRALEEVHGPRRRLRDYLRE